MSRWNDFERLHMQGLGRRSGMKVTSKIRILFVFVAFLHLTSCTDTRAQRFPPALDYCAKEGRKIPNDEKIARVLMRLYKDEKKDTIYTEQLDGSKVVIDTIGVGPEYVREELDVFITPKSPDTEIIVAIREYLKENPLCCQILKPDHLGYQIWNGDAWMADTGYIKALKWGYVSDIYIFNSSPFHKIDKAVGKTEISAPWQSQANPGRDAPGNAYMLNNCAEIQDFDRG